MQVKTVWEWLIGYIIVSKLKNKRVLVGFSHKDTANFVGFKICRGGMELGLVKFEMFLIMVETEYPN
jgi:hypothetical protein